MSCQTLAAVYATSVINIFMIYTWLVTVQRKPDDAFVYARLGKVQHTQMELRYMGFKLYTLEDYYSFIAEHHQRSMITLAQLTLDYITCSYYDSNTNTR